MTMHEFPDTVFRPKDARNPQSQRDDILSSSNPGFVLLYLYHVCKVTGRVLRYVLETSNLAISVIRCGPFYGLSSLLPSTHRRAKGVRKAYVVLMRIDLLQRLGVPL